MPKRIKITSKLAPTIRVTTPLARSVSPELVAEALGAEQAPWSEAPRALRDFAGQHGALKEPGER